MPSSVPVSEIMQAAIDAILNALQQDGATAANVYLVDRDEAPEPALEFAVQLYEDDGTQRHARSGVGMYNGAFAVSIWTGTQVDPTGQATVRVSNAMDMAQKVREALNGNWLDNKVIIPVTCTTWGRVASVEGASGWVRSTDTFAYASYFLWKNNGTVPVG